MITHDNGDVTYTKEESVKATLHAFLLAVFLFLFGVVACLYVSDAIEENNAKAVIAADYECVASPPRLKRKE